MYNLSVRFNTITYLTGVALASLATLNYFTSFIGYNPTPTFDFSINESKLVL